MKSIGPALALLVCATAYGESPELIANVSTAVVSVEPDADLTRRIALPDLEFDFTVSMDCGAALEASRVSISVADTRRSYAIIAAEDRRNLDTSLAVPKEQIAPVAAEGFCVLDEPQTQNPVVLAGLLTAQVSLLCSRDLDSEMHFTSQALAVKLVCGTSEDAAQASFSTLR